MNQPVRLQKKETPTIAERIDDFINNHLTFFIGCLVGLLFALFIVLLFVIVGVSTLESGGYYNNMSRWI